jgi:TonB-like protein
MDVSVWINARSPPAGLDGRALGRLYSPAAIGLLSTLVLHAAIIGSIHLESRARVPTDLPEILKDREVSVASHSQLVLVELPAIDNSRGRQEIDSLRSLTETGLRVRISLAPFRSINAGSFTLSEEAPPDASVDNDGDELTRLFGMYTGQIQARIERAWRRPRTAVDEGVAANTDVSFQCRATIIQDNSGNVQEILLPNCNGSAAWQHSLVLAIRQASPLPAPPIKGVFNHSITLSFVGFEYTAGSVEADYEPLRRHD